MRSTPCDGQQNSPLVMRLKNLSRKRKGRVVTTLVTRPAALQPADHNLEGLLLEGVISVITPRL